MPHEAALSPVASATEPLKIMANGSPLPAFSVVSPSAAKRPVPMIIAAVTSIAVVRPSVRRSDDFDSAAFWADAIKQLSILPGHRRFRVRTSCATYSTSYHAFELLPKY